MFKEVEIKSFRGIDYLKLEQFGRVNVFFGKNNCGKTTVLEGIFLLSGMSNPLLPERINMLRNKLAAGLENVKYLFRNVDTNNHPRFVAVLSDNEQRMLELSLRDNDIVVNEANLPKDTMSSSKHDMGGLCVTMEYTHKISNHSTRKLKSEFCMLSDGHLQKSISATYQEALSARFITCYTEANSLNDGVSNIVKQNKKSQLIEYTQIFDPRIKTIESLPDSVYVGYEGMNELLPISMCGEGLKKYLYILVSLVGSKNGILLIDELENGIHFSVYHQLWKSLFELSEQTGMQLFVTTHSKELLTSLASYLYSAECTSYAKEEVRAYTIARTAGPVMKAYRYTSEGIRGAVESNIELRS